MIRGLIFDINGTLTDILTNEEQNDLYRVVSHFLIYQGIEISPEELKRLYFDINKRQRADSQEEHPEFDAVVLFEEIIEKNATDYTKKLSNKKLKLLPEITAELFRAASLFQLQLYPNVKKTLQTLQKKYKLAAVSDGQAVWAKAELNAVGLADFFNPLLVSSDYGYRKPDHRLFKKALKKMNMKPEEVIFIGNDLYRDIYGANEMGIKSVFFKSNQGDHTYAAAKPDYTITRFADLETAIKSLAAEAKKKARK
ncbi:MAG: HAD family hydrolase [Alphaproteobacteria bacterium]|nr:HAD family hydrolase [Alphaproteobacteria bacterium]